MFVATGRELSSAPEIVVWLASCGTTGVPPATLGAPVSYGVGGLGAGAGAGGLAVCVGFAGRVFPFGAVTRMVGSCEPARAGGCPEAGAVAGWPSPAVAGADAGALVAGPVSAGSGGDCAKREGAVCANAPAQSDEIKSEVDASNRGRTDTTAPRLEVGKLPRRPPQ